MLPGQELHWAASTGGFVGKTMQDMMLYVDLRFERALSVRMAEG